MHIEHLAIKSSAKYHEVMGNLPLCRSRHRYVVRAQILYWRRVSTDSATTLNRDIIPQRRIHIAAGCNP
jgi:hypothetical protein